MQAIEAAAAFQHLLGWSVRGREAIWTAAARRRFRFTPCWPRSAL